MPTIHDPYLNTVRRTLNEEKIKSRKKKIEEKTIAEESFFSKNIIISEYIYLPEGVEKFLLINLFLFLPYLLGVIIMLVILNIYTIEDYTTFNFDLFMLHWTIGYETLAVLLLLLIMKSAFIFKPL